MNFIDKAIKMLSPTWAMKRQLARDYMALGHGYFGHIKKGGAYNGASRKRSMANWSSHSGDNNSGLLDELDTLRDRSRDLYRNAPAARAAIRTISTNAIGSGLVMRSIPDAEVLRMTNNEAQAWADKTEREFKLWADSALSCDYNKRMTFSEIQVLANRAQQISGDVFVLMPWESRPGTVYNLKVQLIDANRITNPYNAPDNQEIAGGIEFDGNGVPIACYIQTPAPNDNLNTNTPEWERIEFYGSRTGRRNIIQVMEHDWIDQIRGEPILSPVIETLLQISKYSEAELTAAVINAMLALFIKRSSDYEGDAEYSDEYDDNPKPWERSNDLKLQGGSVIEGAPGEEPVIVNSARPSSQFDPFFIAAMKQIGMALELPVEVLMKHFSSSYSASRAALLEAWKMFKTRRQFIITNLCQPVYEEFLTEAVINGRINAPGFLSDPVIRSAYCRSQWIGPTQGQLDPGKEYDAANKAVEYGFTTRGIVTAELFGHDHDEIIKELSREQQLRRVYDVNLNTMMFQPIAANDEEE